MKNRIITVVVAAICSLATLSATCGGRIGIIGLDTSHAIAFTKMLNDTVNPRAEFAGFSIVAAYPHGSRTIKSSYERIPKYVETVKSYGVEIVDSIDELLKKVDFVLLETNDGTMHLEQAAQVFRSGKPMFIDKPVAACLRDAIAIFELSKKYNVPIYTSSSLRYTVETQEIQAGKFGPVIGADSYGPAEGEPSHNDFSWYGIHAVEALFTVMGTGCQSVTRSTVPGTSVVVGVWDDGRIGTFRGNITSKYVFGGTVFTKKGAHQMGSAIPYDALLKQIVTFFNTGVSPVSPKETLEIFTFMEASNLSRERGGVPVTMQETYEINSKEALKILKKF